MAPCWRISILPFATRRRAAFLATSGSSRPAAGSTAVPGLGELTALALALGAGGLRGRRQRATAS